MLNETESCFVAFLQTFSRDYSYLEKYIQIFHNLNLCNG